MTTPNLKLVGNDDGPDLPFLVFGAPQIADEEIEEINAALRSGWLGTGPRVGQFESSFRTYKGARHAIAMNSCTAALHLSMLAAGIEPGDEVITTPLTFCATVNAIIHAGATPVLADVDHDTMNIDAAAVQAAVTPRTKAIVPVHFAGRACDMDALTSIARAHNLVIIEDCAHAIETEYKGRQAGTIGEFGCFSFYVTKNICTGEGGMVLTSDADAAARIKRLALHGLSADAWKRYSDAGYRHYFVVEPGFKYNMMDLQAALGIHQLARVEQNWHRRQSIWKQYSFAFTDAPFTLPTAPEPDSRHAYHLYPILIDEEQCGVTRDAFINAMHEQDIGTGVHYLSLAEHPCYQERYGWRPQEYPNAMRLGRQTVSLPLSPTLSDSDVARVVDATMDVLASTRSRKVQAAA